MKTQILVHFDDTDGVAPVLAQIYVEGSRLHLTFGGTDGCHISLYDDDVLKAFEEDIIAIAEDGE